MNNIDHNILAYNAAMFAAIFGTPAPRPQSAKEEEKEKGQTDEQD